MYQIQIGECEMKQPLDIDKSFHFDPLNYPF